MKSQVRKVLAGLALAVAALAISQPVQADHFEHGHGHVHGIQVWHPSSVHFNRVYHPTRIHWTPGRGLHTHGHYDLVPHRTPGHFDLYYSGHIHGNPWYHGD